MCVSLVFKAPISFGLFFAVISDSGTLFWRLGITICQWIV